MDTRSRVIPDAGNKFIVDFIRIQIKNPDPVQPVNVVQLAQ